jgi:hypothetical protein
MNTDTVSGVRAQGIGEQMAAKAKVVAVVVGLVVAATLGVGCSSDDDSSSDVENTTGGSSGSVNAEYETWCGSVKDLVDQSSPGDLSATADLAAFNQAIVSLTATAPEPIQSDMQTLATATDAKLTAVQADPTATLPQALADDAEAANVEVSAFVSTNCGVELPTIDL